jgi:regulatory protein
MKETSAESALNRALRLLRYRARSQDEIRSRLKLLGFAPSITEATLRKLVSLNLLNDASFARNWALTRIERRGYGPLRVARELRQKGIPQPLIEQVLREGFSAGDTTVAEKARRLLEKRFRGQDLRSGKELRRAAAFLQRRGYPYAVIVDLLSPAQGEP